MVNTVIIVDRAGAPLAGVTVTPAGGSPVVTGADGVALVDAGGARWLAIERAGSARRFVGVTTTWPLRVILASSPR